MLMLDQCERGSLEKDQTSGAFGVYVCGVSGIRAEYLSHSMVENENWFAKPISKVF
jgi:hypothetical protein